MIPRKGIIVSELDIDTLRQVFEARSPCESQVAQLAARRAEAADIESMEEALSEVDELIDGRRFRELIEADEKFHVSLANAARNEFLKSSLAALYGTGIRFWYMMLPDRPAAVVKEEMSQHREVLKWIKKRNPEKAGEAMLTVIGGYPDRVADVLRRDVSVAPKR